MSKIIFITILRAMTMLYLHDKNSKLCLNLYGVPNTYFRVFGLREINLISQHISIRKLHW